MANDFSKRPVVLPLNTPAGLRDAEGKPPHLAILGTRGIPAWHGGFETFAQELAPWLVQQGWRVDVYCQDETGDGASEWRGVRLIQLPVRRRGSLGSIEFDWISARHAVKAAPLVLTLGYNTALIGLLYRLGGVRNVINMDGLEWKRTKWSWPVRQWFRLNERAAVMLGNHLVADHPAIAKRLSGMTDPSRITMIPYGAESLPEADPAPLAAFGLEPEKFMLSIARVERENQTLQIVRGFSARPRGVKLAVAGGLEPGNAYHDAVRAAASPEVVFLGPVFQKEAVAALRVHTLAHIHGHTVGGTNPSLVEALGAGCPVIAHRNLFNGWVAGEEQRFFSDVEELDHHITALIETPPMRAAMSAAARARHAERFTWEPVLRAYQAMLVQQYPVPLLGAERELSLPPMPDGELALAGGPALHARNAG